MLDVEDLTFKYSQQGTPALRCLTFNCSAEGVTAIVGGSGVGKSTLIALLAGIYTPSDPVVGQLSGRIGVDGKAPKSLRGPSMISWVPQEPVLLDHLSALDNVLLPLTIGTERKPDTRAAIILLENLGMRDFVNSRPRNLSGGMRTRVSLARALVTKPKYLFLDEPFAGIDLLNRWKIYRLIKDLRTRPELTTIMTSHDLPEAVILSNRIVLMTQPAPRTNVKIFDNDSFRPDLGKVADCLRAAREVALPIEDEMLSNP